MHDVTIIGGRRSRTTQYISLITKKRVGGERVFKMACMTSFRDIGNINVLRALGNKHLKMSKRAPISSNFRYVPVQRSDWLGCGVEFVQIEHS